MTTTIAERLNQAATRLSDEQLAVELRCAERCALLATRSRRDLALMRIRCLCAEAERRKQRENGQNRAR